MNPRIKSVRCLKCNSILPVDDYLYGCPHCLERGENSSVAIQYEGKAEILTENKGMSRYTQFLPYSEFPSIGEGATPVVELKRVADELGLSKVYAKNEFQNPTGSHKDRINPFFIARAKDIGADTICCASTGNEAVSLALYASAAGMYVVCVSTHSITPIWKAAVEASGAELVLVNTLEERKVYLKDKIEKEGWYCTTNQLEVPVGSPCFGIQGYKTISFELYEQFGKNLPDYILIPVGRGDFLYGIYDGFADLIAQGMLDKMPKLVAVEPFPRLELVLNGGDHRNVFKGDAKLTPSIGGATATYQSQYALEHSNGFAMSADQSSAVEAVRKMASNGIYLETSSALAYACLKKAVNKGKIEKGASAMMVLSSHGYKNMPSILEGN